MLCLVADLRTGFGQQVVSVRWPTRHGAAPVSFDGMQPALAATIRLGLATFSEEAIVSAGLLQGDQLGLSASDAEELRGLFAAYYVRLRQSSVFKSAPSALAYCYGERRPAEGLATVYLPASVSTKTRVLVFLHGYGGSLLAYAHYLASVFPNHVVVCPAYGVSCAEIQAPYVREACQAVAAQLRLQPGKPALVGLSAGAFGACRVYAQEPRSFRRLICLGAYPAPDAVKQFNRSMEMRFVCGAKESYVTNGYFQQQMLALKRKVGALEYRVVPGAGHFFLLSHERETRQILASWEK